MGWLTNIGKGIMGAARTVSRLPGISATPLGAAASAVTVGGALFSGGGGSGGQVPTGLPALPQLPGGGGAYAAAGGPLATQHATRGSYAMPLLTIDVIRQLEAAGLMTGFSGLSTYYRSPRHDQVVVHPVQGGTRMTFALNKKLARAWGLWSPARKPPISAGKWHAISQANSAVKTLKRMNRAAKAVANFGTKQRLLPPPSKGRR